MIRRGTKEDLMQIEAFDEFGGDREREVTTNESPRAKRPLGVGWSSHEFFVERYISRP